MENNHTTTTTTTATTNSSNPTEINFPLITVCILVPLSLPIVLINAFILLLYYKNHRLHQSAFLFLISLAMVDLMIGLISTPILAYNYMHPVDRDSSPIKYAASWLIPNILSIVSLLQVILITMERYITIYLPLKRSRWLSMKRMKIMIFTTWSMTIAWWLMPFFTFLWNYSLATNKNYIICSICMFYLCPYFVIIIMWASMLIKARQQQQSQNNISYVNKVMNFIPDISTDYELVQVTKDHLSSDDKKIINTLTFLVIIVTLAYIPNSIWWIMSLFMEDSVWMSIFSLITNALQVNFIVLFIHYSI